MAVRWYLRYGLSYRDVEKLRGERGIGVDHVTIYRWVTRCDGGGGFSVIETDNAENLLHDPRESTSSAHPNQETGQEQTEPAR